MDTDHRKQICYRYFFFEQVIEPDRSENIAPDIQEKSCDKGERIDLVQGFYDISRGNLCEENGNKKKGDNNRDDFYKRVPVPMRN